jgi:putative aldouronate transport system substrate-binding protein
MKEKEMKRFSCTFFVLTLLVSMVSAGGNKAQSGSASGGRPDVLKLTVERPIFSKSPAGTLVETAWRKALDAYMGMPVDLTLHEIPWGDYNERQAVYLAAGDWADIFLTIGVLNQVFDFGSQGMLLNLKDYPAESKNFFELLGNSSESRRITASDGGIYGFSEPLVSTHNGTQELVMVNVDIFKKHNIKVPGNMDELYQTAKQLKALYPDVYPINNAFVGIRSGVMKAFGTDYGIYYNGSRFVYGNTTPAFRQGLEYLRKLYAEKLLDPEFFTDSYDAFSQKMNAGKTFISYGYSPSDFHLYQNLGVIPYMSADGSVPYYPNDNQKGVTLMPYYNIVVNAKTPYPDLAVKALDFQYSPEMITLFNWGIEGTTYTVRPDGSKQFVPAIMNAEVKTDKLAEYGICTSYSVRSGIQLVTEDRDVQYELSLKVPVYLNGNFDRNETWWKYYDDLELAGKSRQFPVAPAVVFTSEENDICQTIIAAVNTLAGEYFLKFVTGEVSLTQWDKYLSDLKAAGDIDRVLSIYNSKL